MDIILERRSVRNFNLDKKVDIETLKLLCKYAEAAPSARKQISREYIIITKREIIDKLEDIYVKSTMRPSKCNALIAVIGKDPSTLPCPDFQTIDLALATENIMLKATELGLGTVMLGTYPAKERTTMANELLNINDNRFVFTFVCVGYPESKDVFYDSNKIEKTTIEVIE